MMLPFSLLIFSLLLASAFADNNWSEPCLSGVCQYDLPASNGSASGTLKIWGPDTAISDITPAAGWQILDCSPDALQQDIRLICKDGSSADCAHLYSGSTNDNNAVGKIVRLPENCGKSAFAVVAKAWTPQDQTIPPNVTSSLTRRDGTSPTVRALHLNTNFSSVNPSSAGSVNFAIRAANVPGANGDIATSPQQQRRSNSRIFGRGISDFVSGAISDISSLNQFNVNNSTTLPPVDVDKTFNLVDQSISCPPVDAKVKVDVDAKAHAVASIGVAASGTLVPPQVSDFSIIAGLTADIDGSVDMQATASGTLDSGKITLFEVGIPGLDFPGILTIGPSFQINGQATATLDLDVGLTVGITYSIDNAQLTFPPKTASKGSFNIGDTPLKLSASPSAKATGTVEAHLIPTLNFGISALDDTVSANIFLELDASASMTLTAQAQADASDTINTSGSKRRDLTKQAARGYHFWSSPSLNSRAPQFDDSQDADDGSQDDANDDSGDFDDSVDASGDSEDSQDDSTDGSTDAGDGSDTDDDEDDGSQDNSADASGDDASTADDADASADVDDDDNGDASSGDDSDSLDNGPPDDDSSSDLSGDSNDGTDASGDDTDDTNIGGTSEDGADDASDDADPDESSSTDNGADADDGADSSDDGTNNNDATAADDPSGSTSTDSTSSDGGNTDGADPTADNTASGSSDALSPSEDSTPSATSTDSSDAAAATATPEAGSVASTDANGSFGGCFSVDAALDVNAGAEGSFFGLFDGNTKVELFSKKFDIFKKCFGSNAARRSMTEVVSRKSHVRGPFFIPPRSARSLLQQRGFSLTCPTAEDGASESQQSIADETVAAADITQE